MAEEKYGNGKMRWVILKAGKFGFTLAEVLITLAVIGIVAALTIGIFLPKIHSQIRAHQIAVAETKFTKAMEQMALNNAIGPYYETTQEFVDELQNYLKIAKVCANDKLEDCFGYDKLLLSNGEEFELAEIKSGENLGKTADGTEYLETIGLVTIDGTGMILSWNKECQILEPKVYPWGNNTNETTSCVAAILDVNLDKSPNRINKDIALFRAESPSKTACGLGFSYGGVKYCWGVPFEPIPITNADCMANKTTYGIKNCRNDNYDCWGGAMKQCKSEGKRLPTMEELGYLAAYLYSLESVGANQYIASGISLDTNKLANLSEALSSYYISNNYLNLWSNEEYSKSYAWQYAWRRRFVNTGTDADWVDRSGGNFLGVCVP